MPIHKCSNCNYTSNLKANMKRHLNKKNKCYETEIIHDKEIKEIKEVMNEPIEINISEPFLNKIKELETIIEDQIKHIEELTLERNEIYNENKRLDDLIEKQKEKIYKYKELTRALATKENVKTDKKEEQNKYIELNNTRIKFL